MGNTVVYDGGCRTGRGFSDNRPPRFGQAEKERGESSSTADRRNLQRPPEGCRLILARVPFVFVRPEARDKSNNASARAHACTSSAIANSFDAIETPSI